MQISSQAGSEQKDHVDKAINKINHNLIFNNEKGIICYNLKHLAHTLRLQNNMATTCDKL